MSRNLTLTAVACLALALSASRVPTQGQAAT